MSEKEQIEKLKQVAMTASTLPAQLAAVDAIGAYGENGIATLLELSTSATVPRVQIHALEVLKQVRGKSSQSSAENRALFTKP